MRGVRSRLLCVNVPQERIVWSGLHTQAVTKGGMGV